MSVRVAVIVVIAAMSLVACGNTTPTATTAVTVAPSASSGLTSPAAPSASADTALPIDDAAYQAGEAFMLPVSDAGFDWTAPSSLPVMPNGQPAMRVAFLPASCAAGEFSIVADDVPEDPWETTLREDGTTRGYTFGSWPAAQVPECADGQGRTYLDVGYHPLAPTGIVHLTAAIRNFPDAPTAIEVIPVYTSADATQPSLTSDGSAAMGPVSGKEKARPAKPQPFFATDFAQLSLPDGSVPTSWNYRLTACGGSGPTTNPVVVTLKVGDAAPVEVGQCSEGSIVNDVISLPIPADGTHVAVLTSGGTTKSELRLSQFQWRGDRP